MTMTPRILLGAVIGALAFPAAAGSWPNLPARKPAPAKAAVAQALNDEAAGLGAYRYFSSEEYRGKRAFERGDAAPAANVRATNGFEFVGGDPGWQLAQHKYLLVGGRFTHSDECDHAIRTAQAPTLKEIESARLASPGA